MSEHSTSPAPSLDLRGRILLLATDGSPASAAAARVTHALAQRHGATVQVVTVIDTSPAAIPPPLDLAHAMQGDASRGGVQHERARELRAALASTLGEPCQWAIDVVAGTPAEAIVEEAARLGAALVVVGLRRHGRLERVMHDETVLDVARTAACPVLGVATDAAGPPQHGLAALDFGEASTRAAGGACSIVARGGRLTLAYVAPVLAYPAGDGEGVIRALGVKTAFERTIAALPCPDATVVHMVLNRAEGSTVAGQLLDYADAMRIDLIVMGTARHGRVERWILGSVSTELMRDGRTSVLVYRSPE